MADKKKEKMKKDFREGIDRYLVNTLHTTFEDATTGELYKAVSNIVNYYMGLKSRFDSCLLTCVESPVTGDHFVFIVFNGTDRNGGEQSLSKNAEHQLIHLCVIFYLEGMAFKGSQLFHRQLYGLYNIVQIKSSC